MKIHHFSTNSMFVTVVERDDDRLTYIVRYPNKSMKRCIASKPNNFVDKVCNRIWELTDNETITYKVTNSLFV